jgi:hypothetical protein
VQRRNHGTSVHHQVAQVRRRRRQGRTTVSSPRRISGQAPLNGWSGKGNRASSRSSTSIPSPGCSLGHMAPARVSGQPGNTSRLASSNNCTSWMPKFGQASEIRSGGSPTPHPGRGRRRLCFGSEEPGAGHFIQRRPRATNLRTTQEPNRPPKDPLVWMRAREAVRTVTASCQPSPPMQRLQT